ncbi:hypothetical protein GCM10027258_47180 [Amycolatopsis stemonae]
MNTAAKLSARGAALALVAAGHYTLTPAPVIFKITGADGVTAATGKGDRP